MPRTTRLIYASAFISYAALACVMTYPLIRQLGSVVPHDIGDPLLSTTILWWNAHTVPLTHRWWDGFAFYPATGMLAFSDHRLGESLIATPLQWLGAGPVTAYNLTFLATFPLCAIAAHWLVHTLTRRHDAAAIAGLSFGFSPYRIAHLPHLELLAAFGMPAALAALHRYRDTRQRRWLAAFAAALIVLGLCSSYYLVFFSVLLALWLLWFVRRGDEDLLRGTLLAGAAAIVLLAPIALTYARIHAYYGLTRPYDEIVGYGADVTSLLTAHSTVALWGWTARWAKPEGELFPGATIVVLAVIGAALAWRRGGTGDRLDRLARLPLLAAAISAAIAVNGWLIGPWRFHWAGASISSDAPFKPMSVAIVALGAWLGLSSRFRDAFARRSAFAFYLLATIALFVCSFGPKPEFAGHQFLYDPPYLWLMTLPIFSSIRVPARFGLSAMLTLATTGALAFDALRIRPPVRRALAGALLVVIAAEGWISPLALPSLPAVWPAARADGFAAVLELPLGDVFGDDAAMYRAIAHGHAVINGTSGFEPTHYFTLRVALDEHDPAALDGFPSHARLLIVVDKDKDSAGAWRTFAASLPRVSPLGEDERWAFFAAEPPAPAAVCAEPDAPISAIATEGSPGDLSALTDRNPHTWWAASHPQQAGDTLLIDLGRTVRPCAVSVSVGEFRISYPRRLEVQTSSTGRDWTTVAVTRTAGLTIRGALADPKAVSIVIPLTASSARFVRLRVAEPHPTIAWLVTDVAVRASRVEE